MSTILAGMHAALSTWAADVTPRPGTVEIAADWQDGYATLKDAPENWRLVIWWDGGGVEGDGRPKGVETVAVGVAMAKGLARRPGRELTHGRGTLPPLLDIMEGVNAACRGLYVGTEPTGENDGCFLMTFRDWQWVRYEAGVSHYVMQLNYTLPRQLPPRTRLAVTLG